MSFILVENGIDIFLSDGQNAAGDLPLQEGHGTLGAAQGGKGADENGYRAGFIKLVRKAQTWEKVKRAPLGGETGARIDTLPVRPRSPPQRR